MWYFDGSLNKQELSVRTNLFNCLTIGVSSDRTVDGYSKRRSSDDYIGSFCCSIFGSTATLGDPGQWSLTSGKSTLPYLPRRLPWYEWVFGNFFNAIFLFFRLIIRSFLPIEILRWLYRLTEINNMIPDLEQRTRLGQRLISVFSNAAFRMSFLVFKFYSICIYKSNKGRHIDYLTSVISVTSAISSLVFIFMIKTC